MSEIEEKPETNEPTETETEAPASKRKDATVRVGAVGKSRIKELQKLATRRGLNAMPPSVRALLEGQARPFSEDSLVTAAAAFLIEHIEAEKTE